MVIGTIGHSTYLGACLLLGVWYAAPSSVHSLLQSALHSDTLRLRFTKYSRPSIWLFEQSPVFGTGLWSYRNCVFEAQAEIHRADPGFFRDYPEPKPESAHNEYLEVLNDGGLAATAAILLFVATILRHGWRLINDRGALLRGDITMWSAYFLKGLVKYQQGSVLAAERAFEKSLFYYPDFEPARQKLEEVRKVIRDHDKVMVKFR